MNQIPVVMNNVVKSSRALTTPNDSEEPLCSLFHGRHRAAPAAGKRPWPLPGTGWDAGAGGDMQVPATSLLLCLHSILLLITL